MARQTRQQRRARREQTQPALAGGPPVQPPARQTSNGGEDPARREKSAPSEERRSGGPIIGFLRESWAELKKVEWPNQHALVSGTAVVIISCLIVGLFLWLNDELWKYVVQHVLLR